MAQVPRLNRIQPGKALPQNDRIDMQVKDNAGSIMNRVQSISSLGDKVGDIYQEYENDKIDQLASEAEREYTIWNNEQMRKLKGIEGDPTEAYVEYDKAAQEKYEEIISKHPDASDRVKRHFSSRVNKVIENQNVAVLKQRGMQQEVYDNNLFESTVKLKRNNLPVVAGYISKDDPSSFSMFDQSMNDIRTVVAKQGLKKGTVTKLDENSKEKPTHVYTDDDGNLVKVKMTDIAKVRVAKELSEGVKSSIDVLIASGATEEAKLMQEKYKIYLDPKSAAAIDKDLQTSSRKEEAFKVLSGIRGLPEADQISAIEGMQDMELRAEVIKQKETADAKLENMRERKAKANYDTLAGHVLQKEYFGVADLEKDPLYKQTWKHLDAKGKKAILEMVKAPKESNEKSLLKMNSLMVGEVEADIEKMSLQEFHQEFLSGLSKQDKNKGLAWFNKQKNPSAAQERMVVKRTNEMVKDRLLKSEYLVKDMYGKIAGEDELRLLAVKEKIISYFADRKTLPSEKEMEDIAIKFAASEIDKKVFNPYLDKPKKPVSDQVNTMQASPRKDKITENPLEGLSATQIVNFKAEFERAKGFKPLKSDPRFLQFIKSKR